MYAMSIATAQQHAKKDFVILLTTFSAGPLFCSYAWRTLCVCACISLFFCVFCCCSFHVLYFKSETLFCVRAKKQQRRRKQIKIIKTNTDALNYNEPFSEKNTPTLQNVARKKLQQFLSLFIYLCERYAYQISNIRNNRQFNVCFQFFAFFCFLNFHSNKYSHFQSSCTFPSNKINNKKIEIRKFRKLNQFLLHNMHLFCFFLLLLLLEVTTTKIREKISFFVTTRTVCSCVCMLVCVITPKQFS